MKNSDLANLIERFWSGKASNQEKRILFDYLDCHHRELKVLLEGKYGQEDSSAIANEIEVRRADEWLRRIHARAGMDEEDKKKPSRIRSLAWTAAAAMMIVGLGVVWMLQTNLYENKVMVQQVAKETSPVTYRNTGKEDMRIVLPDSSTVLLSPLGKLTYSADYGIKARGVQLHGKALFSVERQLEKPFTVYANGFATTALGTEFTVSTQEAGHTTVRLLSGKVVVNPIKSSQFAMAAVYLSPGEELRIDALTERISIVNTLKEPWSDSSKPTTTGTPMHGIDRVEVLHFNRTPLREVFQRIAEMKGVTILANEVNLDDLSFSGDFLPTDSLETILTIVCTMNDLNYRHENDHVVILKR